MEFNEIWKNVNNLKDELLMPFKMHSTGISIMKLPSIWVFLLEQ